MIHLHIFISTFVAVEHVQTIDNLIRRLKASICRAQVTTITPGDCWVHCTIIVVITITASVLVSLVRFRFQLEQEEHGLQLLVVLRPVERCDSSRLTHNNLTRLKISPLVCLFCKWETNSKFKESYKLLKHVAYIVFRLKRFFSVYCLFFNPYYFFNNTILEWNSIFNCVEF